jgi:hypothetical protein
MDFILLAGGIVSFSTVLGVIIIGVLALSKAINRDFLGQEGVQADS